MIDTPWLWVVEQRYGQYLVTNGERIPTVIRCRSENHAIRVRDALMNAAPIQELRPE